jgi:uncharacterized protein YyaL (SSP411 family)
MVGGLAIATRALGRVDLADSATRAVDFLRTTLWQNGRLLATHKDGRSQLPAYLDDYAFLADGLLELLQVRWRRQDLDFAVALTEAMLTYFEDPENGGFWFTANDSEALIHRSKTFADEALPAGNGIAARVLGRLGNLLGEPRYLRAAERTLRAAWSAIGRQPAAHASLLDALEEQLSPAPLVILRGPVAELREWEQALFAQYAPGRLVIAIPADARDVPEPLSAKTAGPGTIGYLCRGQLCEAPYPSLAALLTRLSNPD